MRFGAAAQEVQSTGAHAYFPLVARTLIGGAALTLLGGLLLIGLARVSAGRRLEKASAPSLLRLLAALYTLQLAVFLVQETVEGSPAGQLFLWGLLGQMPVAFAGAAALRWLFARLGPALAFARCTAALQLEVHVVTVAIVAAVAGVVRTLEAFIGPLSPRAPPQALLPKTA